METQKKLPANIGKKHHGGKQEQYAIDAERETTTRLSASGATSEDSSIYVPKADIKKRVLCQVRGRNKVACCDVKGKVKPLEGKRNRARFEIDRKIAANI